MRTNIPAGRDVSFRFHFEGYNDAMGCAINTIVCGREGREGNVLVSGVDGVTTDVDAERTRSLSVRHLAPGIGRVTARLDNATKLLVLELHAGERGSWAVAGFSVSVAVVSPEYGAGFVCAVSFETKTIAHPSAAASGSQAQ